MWIRKRLCNEHIRDLQVLRRPQVCPPGGLFFQSSGTFCEDSFLRSSLWQRCHMHGALASTCCAAKAGVRIREAFLHTQSRVFVHKCICLSLMWLCSFELIQYHAEVNGRWVNPTSLLMGVQFAWAHPCFEADYCSQQIAAFSPSPFVFFSMKIPNILCLSEVFLAIQNHIFVRALCSPNTWGSKWQALETDGAQYTPEKSSWSAP